MPTLKDFDGSFACMLDGDTAFGFVKSFSGGNIRGKTSRVPVGPDSALRRKQLVSHSHDDIALTFGAEATPQLIGWVKSEFETGGVTRTGEVHVVRNNLESLQVREFLAARITEITLPELSVSSKDLAYIAVKATPGSVRHRAGMSAKIDAKPVRNKRQWKSANFRITVPGLPTDHVTKVELPTYRAGASTPDRAEDSVESEPEISNIILTMPITHGWQKWSAAAQQAMISGEGLEPVNVTAELLSEDADALAHFELRDCGLVAVNISDLEANAGALQMFEAELFVDSIALSV